MHVIEQVVALILFSLVVAAIVGRVVDEVAVGLVGLVLLILLTSYTPHEAFHAVDWNVIFILLGMWIITAYMVEGGVAARIASILARRAENYRSLVAMLALTAGLVSMFVDNVLVVLLFGAIVLDVAKRAGADPVPAILLIGFSANYMGTALLMGDLPPQLLHSIGGAEFLDFIWFQGRPSSFILLLASFIAVTAITVRIFVKENVGVPVLPESMEKGSRTLLIIGVTAFTGTVAAMAIRPLLGLPLGFITVAGAAAAALAVEAARKLMDNSIPSFGDIVSKHVEWRALMFYAILFSLVGGLEKLGVLDAIAHHLLPLLEASPPIPYTAFYWLVASLSTFIEHDALLLTFLYTVRDAARMVGLDPWPIYWAMAWSATLASNATTAAAPALYVAVTIAEREGYRVTGARFLKHSLVYVALSLLIHYTLSLPVWGFP